MGRQSKKTKLYLLMMLIVSSFGYLIVHFKLYPRDDDIFALEKLFHYTRTTAEKERNSEIIFGDNVDYTVCQTSPSSLMEQTRRHISQTARYQWFFMRSQIRMLLRTINNETALLQNVKKMKTTLKYMMDHGSEYKRVINLEVKKLATLDGWDDWRRREADALRTIVRTRLIRLQNPQNCSSFPILVCNLTNPFGFASGVHDILWCFIKAYSSHQRLVLETSHWHYSPSGWKALFLPLSDACPDEHKEFRKSSPWPGRNNNKARWIMRTLPEDLGTRIIRLENNPLAWWYGQFLGYLMRPNNHLQSFINKILRKMNFSQGIVGIHIRRTDKVGNEARAHKLEEYMEHAEDYFQSIELVSSEIIKRRVYIATDEPSVLKECDLKYPHYDCLYNPGCAEMASNLKTRYSNESFWCLLADIFALSQSDFIVCTMSSGICRVAYELKLAMKRSSNNFTGEYASLDIPHHYAWITPASKKAIYNHKSQNLKEMSFMKGDVLVYKNDHSTVQAASRGKVFDGFVRLGNKMQNTEGLVPIYKTKQMFQFSNQDNIY